jgi:putative ABC transport system permease protein
VIAPRWKKVVRDVLQRPGRSLLAVLALAAGVFEIGALLYKYAVLQPLLTTMYAQTHPASATLVVDGISDALVDSVRRVGGVADAEARPVLLARGRTGPDEWAPVMVSVIRDFDHQRIDTFQPEDGAWPPGPGEVLLERSALTVAKLKIGDSLRVRTPGGVERSLRVAGTVHAAGLPPAWMDHFVPAFVGWGSVLRQGTDEDSESEETAQLRIVVADHPLDEGYIREVADSVKTLLERRGRSVTRITVPPPGRHPHADQMDAFLYLLGAFGILSFALSAVLVASMIHALLAEQVRQVGIMKALGARTRQIAGIYLGQVALLAAAALAIGIPIGLAVGRAYAQFSASILNADVTDSPFPWWVVSVEIVVGIGVPLLVALGPVLRASRISIHQALSGDFTPRAFGSRGFERWLARHAWLPRPLLLSLRTTFVRRGRLALTIGMLALGGGAFMAAMNVAGAWDHAVRQDFSRRRYDLTVMLAERTEVARLSRLLEGEPAVVHAEYWPGANPYLIDPHGIAGGAVALVGPDPGSALLDLALLGGRWLEPADTTGAVVNAAVVARNPSLRVGRDVQLRLDGRTLSLPILGVVKELSPMPVVYAPRPAVLRALHQDGRTARSIRVVTRLHDDASQREVARRLERRFAEAGIEVSGMQRMLDVRQSILDHLVIILAVLSFASGVIVFVGGLALTSSLMLSVVQRTREIGVLGAIGAAPATISRHVWLEGLLIGVLSWVVANLVAAPISVVLEAVCGRIFFRVPLDFYMSPRASATWLLLVVVLGSLSSFYPAWRASRLTVREALSHA